MQQTLYLLALSYLLIACSGLDEEVVNAEHTLDNSIYSVTEPLQDDIDDGTKNVLGINQENNQAQSEQIQTE